ncbi:Uncharacterized protein GBIM_10632 [Gryllus bimaculatus]|nr:Uncharacterized protein GBIM_10632 [Gryllus bimaculatus]
MGISGLDRELWSIKGCVVNVSIKELVEKYGKNVIVVDGFNFYGLYLYPKFDWVCGAFRDLVQEIRFFVESFERIGIKLVFFFVEGNLDEGSDSCGSPSWKDRRSEHIKYSQMVFTKIPKWNYHQHDVKKNRAYYHTPLNALPVVLFALRHLFKCEVHFVYAGDRNDAVAYYSGNNNCLAVLGQDNYYIFYRMVPRYLSIKQLNLIKMTTVQYCPAVFARHRDLVGHLYPIFLKDGSPNYDQTDILFKIEAKLDESESVDVARKKIHDYLHGKELKEVLDVGDLNIENARSHLHQFILNVLRYKLGFDYPVVCGPLKKWDLIKLRSQELYASGEISRCIERILMEKKYFNDCILEDFTELPPSSEVYQCLRNELYNVLLSEEPNPEDESDDSNSDDPETPDGLKIIKWNKRIPSDGVLGQPGPAGVWERKLFCVTGHSELHKFKLIQDWYMNQMACPSCELVNVKITLHTNLLQLWCKNNITSNITEKKWQLFQSCISDNLQWQTLSLLPPTLVVPTVVLYYLFNVVPLRFKTKPWNFLKMWEVEVFIAQAVMLSKIDADSLSRINIEKLNRRVVNLIAFFVYGCHHVRLLIEACGHPISEHDLCVFHYFDGKLFHSFYDRAEWRRNARNLCDQETSPLFEKMKQIIIPGPLGRH